MTIRLMTLGVAVAGMLATTALEGRQMPADKAMVDKHISNWTAKPKELATKLMAKYGQPHEATPQRLIWHNNGPWKMTELVNEEIPHDFPVPHVDMLYQTINYKIDPKHADELLEYDGSVILERTKGEIAARCDKEEPNFLAINLAHDIVMGKRSVSEARKHYAESMMKLMKSGNPNNYQTGFIFSVEKGPQGDRDMPAKMPMM